MAKNNKISLLSGTCFEANGCDFFSYKGKLFKVSTSNGNAFCHLDVYEKTLNGDFALIAHDYEIAGFAPVSYIESPSRRIAGNRSNIEAGIQLVIDLYDID